MTFPVGSALMGRAGVGGGFEEPGPGPDVPPPYVPTGLDQFNRTVARAIQPDLGISDSNNTWSWSGSDSNAVEMTGGYLRFYGPNSGADGSGETWFLSLGAPFLITDLSNFGTISVKFRFSVVHSVANNYTDLRVNIVGGGSGQFHAAINNVAGGLAANGGYIDMGGVQTAKHDWVAGDWYIVKFTPTGDDLEAKVWREVDGEGSATVATDPFGEWPGDPGDADGRIEIEVSIDASVGGTDVFGQTFDIDYIDRTEGTGGGGGGVIPPVDSSWMTPGIPVGSFDGWPLSIPTPMGGTTKTWTGSTSLQSFLSSLDPGDVGVLDYTGTVSGNVTVTFPNCTSSDRIYIVNAPGKRPVGSGLLHISGGSYWSMFGLNWTTNGSVTSSDHMVKLDNGNHWEWGCCEVWGGACYTEVRPGQSADYWRITTAYIHNNPGPHGTANQDHLIYADPSSANSHGLIERCLLINSPHGRGVKIGGPSSGGPAIGGITVRNCTCYNNLGPSNIQVSNGATLNLVENCILQKPWSSSNMTRGGGLLAGAGNVIKDTIGWESSSVAEIDGDTLIDGGGLLHVDPGLNLTTFAASAPAAAGKGHLA